MNKHITYIDLWHNTKYQSRIESQIRPTPSLHDKLIKHHFEFYHPKILKKLPYKIYDI